MGEVDPAFIQEYKHRPKLNVTEAGGIPVIDLSPLNNSELSNDQQLISSLVSEIGNACKDWGFFQVINHGVHSDLPKRIELEAKKLFGLSTEEKRKVSRDEENPLGYYDTEHTKNVRDWKEVFDFTVSNPTILPALHNPEDHEVALFCRQTSSAEEKTIHLLQSTRS
ncbi:hypothetical protein IFM89_027453 [Coptis chinensis]|uniref:Non-haem dioxygenase N-terminal domain-containing protein n=1 Tax=Coptis chinensis TaxID=261450 RepID=A0A835I6T0_9MAGN|nr:hypothetical protein IFM89_027453 [Coptis chinensis]